MNFFAFVILSFLLLASGCHQPDSNLPAAAKHDHETWLHGDRRQDPYQYLTDSNHPDTVNYMAAEQAYTAAQTAQWGALRRQFQRELNATLSDRSKTMPVVLDGYEYYRELTPGFQYPRFMRRPVGIPVRGGGQAELVLDLNQLATGSQYFQLGGFTINPAGNAIAFTEDRDGDQRFTLKVLNMASGEYYPILIENVAAGVAWSAQNEPLYVRMDQHAVFQSSLNGSKETAVYREADLSFNLSVRQSRERDFAVITAQNQNSVEIRVVGSRGVPVVVAPRTPGHLYRVRIHEESLYILTNWRKSGFELAYSNAGGVSPDDWTYVDSRSVEEGLKARLEDFEIFNSHFVLQEKQGLKSFIVGINRSTGKKTQIAVSASGGAVRLSANPDPLATEVRYEVSNLAKPGQVLHYNLLSGIHDPLVEKTQDLPNRYATDEIWFEARDGVRVPVTLLYKGSMRGKGSPGYITAYGAYGVSLPLEFDPGRVPLLEQGFLMAQIHVRGGGELGADWHQQGRLGYKKNAINDFIDGTRFLVEKGYVAQGQVFAQGSSAGATLVAAAINSAPDLFRAVVCRVPFVDVINTLLDNEHPLTASDHLEWGDPRRESHYQWMKAYSPYDRVGARAYPDILITTAINDSRVYYSEALKWLARLREFDRGQALKLIDIDLNTGHLGASDQYEMRRKESLEYAFILSRLEK